MKSIAIVNLKGGVGKTVTACNMAAILAADHQKRVLLVDCDSQCNASEFFGACTDPREAITLSAVLTGQQEPYYEENIQATDVPGLCILAASDDLMDLDLAKLGHGVNGRALAEFCEAIAEDSAYDYILFDCPPAFNAASAAALVAADEVIVPMKLDAFSLRGMANLLHQIENMRKLNPRLRLGGVLITMWKPTDRMRQALTQLEAKLPVYLTPIRATPKVDEMTFAGQPITVFSPKSAAGRDYRRFVKEYMKGELDHGI